MKTKLVAVAPRKECKPIPKQSSYLVVSYPPNSRVIRTSPRASSETSPDDPPAASDAALTKFVSRSDVEEADETC